MRPGHSHQGVFQILEPECICRSQKEWRSLSATKDCRIKESMGTHTALLSHRKAASRIHNPGMVPKPSKKSSIAEKCPADIHKDHSWD